MDSVTDSGDQILGDIPIRLPPRDRVFAEQWIGLVVTSLTRRRRSEQLVDENGEVGPQRLAGRGKRSEQPPSQWSRAIKRGLQQRYEQIGFEICPTHRAARASETLILSHAQLLACADEVALQVGVTDPALTQ